jgi:hypothetical protein
MGTLQEFIVSHWIILGKRNRYKCYKQNQNMHFMPIHVARNHAAYGVLQEILHSERPGTWLFTIDVLWCDI